MDKTFIDKLAYIHLRDGKVLVSLSKGKNVWYIPGGKREGEETDQEALIREVMEELNVELLPETIQYYGTFEAQAHGKPKGTIVRMTCYSANFNGTMIASSEIEKIEFFKHSQRSETSPVDHLIFDDLKSKNLIK